MVARVIAVEPFDLVIFGATGDLAVRKLIPALYFRDLAGQIPAECRIIGASRRPLGDDGFREMAHQSLNEHVKKQDRTKEHVERFLARLSYFSIDATGHDGWADLGKALDQDGERIRVFYLATGPDLFGPICQQLGRHKLATANSRVVVEKPIGKSLDSAREVNDAIGEVFPEDRVYRIDHYLGKETVQNLMALRFANAMFEPVWNSAHIDHVQITVAETLGVEGRAGYYDTAGALRDMAQNHLLQLLCLTAMEPPTSLAADAVRDEKLKVLQSLVPITPEKLGENTVRGQYRAGASEDGPVKGYLEELGEDTSSTETFVALKAQIANWRWAGVPFYLRTGKRLGRRVTEIAVVFKKAPHLPFESTATEELGENALVFRVQPDEGVTIRFGSKVPGTAMEVRDVTMDFGYGQAFTEASPEAYERLLLDVLLGEPPLFPRHREVELSWEVLDPVEQFWAEDGQPEPYPAGTWGPASADAMLARSGRVWRRP